LTGEKDINDIKDPKDTKSWKAAVAARGEVGAGHPPGVAAAGQGEGAGTSEATD